MATSLLFQPRSSGPGDGEPKVSVGSTVSRRTVTDSDVVPPADVAVQVNVTPAVSSVAPCAVQPTEELMADSWSVTLHDTCTLLRYQPAVPAVPVILATTTGGVGSRSP